MKHKVNAVIVTCNRCELLKMALENLFNQTYRLNKIVVVNNASTDGTKEYLDSLNNEQLCIIHKEVNEGGAGGFYYGVKEAYNLGCDFVWIMDDDTICTPDSLENLMSSYEVIQDRNVGFLGSNVLFKDETPCFMNICHPDYVWNEFAAEGIVRVTHCSFVAMLIPSWVIKDVGLPIKEYFIWGDDGEYSTRILRKYEGYVCAKSKVYHYMNSNVGVDIWNVEEKRIDRFFYFYRNWMCTHLMRNKEDAARFEKESEELIKAIKKSNTSFKEQKIKVIREGIKAGKSFNVQIKGPDEKPLQHESGEKNEYLLNKKILRPVKKYLIKYDIRSNGAVSYCKNLYNKYRLTENKKNAQLKFVLDGYKRTELFDSGNKTTDLVNLFKKVKIDFVKSDRFAYSIDVYKTWKIKDRQMANCPVDYSLFVDNSLSSLLMNDDGDYEKKNNDVVSAIELYINRMENAVSHSNLRNKANIKKWF